MSDGIKVLFDIIKGKTNLNDRGPGFCLRTETEEKRREREQRDKSISGRGGGESVSGRGNLRKVAWAPPPARKGSDAIPPRLNPRWNSLRAQNKKKEERALEMKQKKKLMSRDDVPRPPTAPCSKIETCGRAKIRVREKPQQVPERHEGCKAK